MQPSAFLLVCLISRKQSASLLIRTVIDWSAARYAACPMGRYPGQMQRTLTLGEKGHRAELSPQEIQSTRQISERMNRIAAGSGHFFFSAMLLTRMLSEDVWVGDPRFVSLRGRFTEVD